MEPAAEIPDHSSDSDSSLPGLHGSSSSLSSQTVSPASDFDLPVLPQFHWLHPLYVAALGAFTHQVIRMLDPGSIYR